MRAMIFRPGAAHTIANGETADRNNASAASGPEAKGAFYAQIKDSPLVQNAGGVLSGRVAQMPLPE